MSSGRPESSGDGAGRPRERPREAVGELLCFSGSGLVIVGGGYGSTARCCAKNMCPSHFGGRNEIKGFAGIDFFLVRKKKLWYNSIALTFQTNRSCPYFQSYLDFYWVLLFCYLSNFFVELNDCVPLFRAEIARPCCCRL